MWGGGGGERGRGTAEYVQRSEDNFWDCALSFHHEIQGPNSVYQACATS